MNQMWGGEPSKLLATKGYWIIVGAKPLYVIDETFCSIPTNDANYQYMIRLTSEALVVWYKPAKSKGSGGGVPTASPMLKLAKG